MNKWEDGLKKNITKVDEISQLINKDEIADLKEVTSRFPMSIPQYYYDLIDENDPEDPIRKLSVPAIMETDTSGEMDTSGESQNTKFEGVQHKYNETMLVLTTNACFMYCRHCFRKRLVGYTNSEVSKRMDDTVDYLMKHKEINNILLTGGDSFALSTDQIEMYLENLTKVEHLDFIRFGTRVPVVYPMRIYEDQKLLEILKRYNQVKQLMIVTQFNHPVEVTDEAKKAIKMLLDMGITVNNQMVLLKGVNDQPETIADLMSKLTAVGVTPYYVFQCRPVSRVKNQFELPLSEAYDIVENAKKIMSGPAKRFKFAMSHPRGKIEIIGKTETQMIFKFHQAKADADKSMVFIRDINESARWLDYDLNLVDYINMNCFCF